MSNRISPQLLKNLTKDLVAIFEGRGHTKHQLAEHTQHSLSARITRRALSSRKRREGGFDQLWILPFSLRIHIYMAWVVHVKGFTIFSKYTSTHTNSQQSCSHEGLNANPIPLQHFRLTTRARSEFWHCHLARERNSIQQHPHAAPNKLCVARAAWANFCVTMATGGRHPSRLCVFNQLFQMLSVRAGLKTLTLWMQATHDLIYSICEHAQDKG